MDKKKKGGKCAKWNFNPNVFAVSLVAVLLCVGTVYAGGYLDNAININNSDVNINLPAQTGQPTAPLGTEDNPIIDGEEGLLGGTYTETSSTTATSTTDLMGIFGLSIADTLQFKYTESGSKKETWHLVERNFNTGTTTLFAIQMLESSSPEQNARVYIVEILVKFTGMSTTTRQFFIGTTSVAYINPDDTWINRSNISADARCSLFDNGTITDGTVLDATNTVMISDDNAYKPCDVGYGASFRNVPILPGQYITGWASSTTGVADAFKTDLLNGKVYIKYRVIK